MDFQLSGMPIHHELKTLGKKKTLGGLVAPHHPRTPPARAGTSHRAVTSRQNAPERENVLIPALQAPLRFIPDRASSVAIMRGIVTALRTGTVLSSSSVTSTAAAGPGMVLVFGLSSWSTL